MIIDAHQHFWQPDRADYGWLTPALPTLYRDFMPPDLAPLLHQHHIDGTVLVQAAPTMAETEFLLEIAEATPFVLGVVGWVDFSSPSASEDIARLARHPKLVGLRPMIQEIEDDDWMLGHGLTPAFEAMILHDLVFDALVLPRHLPKLKKLILRHPDLRTVIDHGAKPDIANGRFDGWASDMADIARHSHVYCKLSGLVTEAGPDWTPAELLPYVDHLFGTFGANRLIWGSDWPVVTLASRYGNWFDIAKAFSDSAGMSEGIFSQNAISAYKLSLAQPDVQP